MKCSTKSGCFANPLRPAALIIFAAILLFSNCSLPKGDGFAIYLTKGDVPPAQMPVLSHVDIVEPPIISIDDIVTYNDQTHELKLTTSAFERISRLSVPVQGRSFVVCIDKQPIYWGAFWTSMSSMSFDGVTILQPTSLEGRPVIGLELGYPSLSFFDGQDPRNNPEALKSLQQAGKLFPEMSSANLDELPHSMKGYELYSWSQDGQWHFTLITGTNRNKTLQEIISKEDVVSEDGWVQIHVIGVDAIQAILGKLPKGEEIYWMTGSRIEPTSANNISFVLPSEPIFNTVKTFTQQHDLTLAIPSSSSPTAIPPSHPDPSTCPEMVFNDTEFAFELRRTLSATYSGEADLGECLYTASRITDGDFESWHSEWYTMAEHFKNAGDQSLAQGHNVSARDSYYRAATYYRTAEFFLHGNPSDPRILETWSKSRDMFVAAANLDATPFEVLSIPYLSTTLPAYFYSVDKSGKPRPLLIVQTGFDGCQEELHPYVKEGLKRGYNVLTFEGPGQGAVIRLQHIPFRADWENVVSPVIDYVISRPDVNPDRIVLWGISLGGYLAPRAAAYEPRIAAVIADGATYDVGLNLLHGIQQAGGPLAMMTRDEFKAYLLTDPAEFNNIIKSEMKTSTKSRWLNEHGMFAFDASSPALFWAKWMDFTLEGSAERIQCPVLVSYSVTDSFDPGGVQAQMLYDHLTSERSLMSFSDEYEAGYHCQMGAWAQSFTAKFDWLDEITE